ncbi:MAG TPA: class I SAM-dependent methyltransferase [Anaerolineales bacterium]|nr:class I SAM-dependent methyltransferase [Anaerolineales bacterium]
MDSSWLYHSFADYRANQIATQLSKFVEPNETVLDCGCGSMRISEMLQEKRGVTAFGADVIRLNHNNRNFCLCSGENLAFKSGSFDVVFLIFTLHHITNPVRALQEGLRVTNKRLIVLEDVYKNQPELKLLKTLDWYGNILISKDMNFPFNFKTENEWKDVFKSLDTKLITVESIRPTAWRPSRHRVFVLEKNNI